MTSPQAARVELRDGSTVSGSLPANHLTVERPALHDRAALLGATVDRLDEALLRFQGRLEPILLPSRPTPASGDTANNDRGDESWLAGFLDAMTAKVDELGTVVHQLTARVDL